ncbi:MAG: GNAT family N-acetyltransferase [Hamadaea sp.]|nr:GNAT family N-acetyltransferase [Hamadaea sp.]NUR98137.1 GNAT family N-acetyltransferase [Kribbellaceae bacterium]NUT04218.1 GNAT family N-acetyltransferase [Hamadaea sp.]
MTTVEIVETDEGDPRVAPLVRELRAELDARYPEEIEFDHPRVKERARFLLALVDGRAAGCCALQALGDGDSELKRMYVRPGNRGLGIGKRLMGAAEELAVASGLTSMRLETGPRQPEAIAVYERAGFTRIPNYPPYDQWELSLCYAKALSSPGLTSPLS